MKNFQTNSKSRRKDSNPYGIGFESFSSNFKQNACSRKGFEYLQERFKSLSEEVKIRPMDLNPPHEGFNSL